MIDFKHILPRARAWNLTVNRPLKQFFAGFDGLSSDAKAFYDAIWLDLYPETTRELDSWENQFALRSADLTEAERRDRLAATWQALGGQDPRYIQDTLQGAGFDVYVHEWWEPGTEPAPGVKACVTPRNPIQWIRREYTGVVSEVECGEALAECGESFAECGNSTEPQGYPLVNKVYETVPDEVTLCGEDSAECGEDSAECGNYFSFINEQKVYIVPNDPDKWPYFLYIGGETFGTLAQVSPNRREEFESLCLKICPLHLWIGVLVEYT